ncbi:hypothetical protein TBLA_0C04950 [Henningerozyma blattae CBS 6284]|uniref:Cyclin N-terminal domain-containing protein n=1 Tax=Henningerozyma blattae (strain ATCC 34711 / CBS 6284 / DSM 70876 / NBRC 10599 / NRRL Y-10934 / UCD 77-7) TaxID=1071380 RepID=I2H1N9_HENB6|nr:hypothetical protein TBLA_0C04950 [Tetrapisispora blattae CBS 6284]CCH60291.1 hypothetical protein TBLA_0C04950 [Tetrapisispora blattae CBS 6284]
MTAVSASFDSMLYNIRAHNIINNYPANTALPTTTTTITNITSAPTSTTCSSTFPQRMLPPPPGMINHTNTNPTTNTNTNAAVASAPLLAPVNQMQMQLQMQMQMNLQLQSQLQMNMQLQLPNPYYNSATNNQPQQQPFVAPQINAPPQQINMAQPPPAPQQQTVFQEEQINGGVSQVLDYNLQYMSEYVVNYTNIIFNPSYSMDKNQLDDNNMPTTTIDLFIKGVSSVLNATRLPSVTIFLALDYLSKYITKLPNGIASIGGNSVNVIYQNTMISFILANKFNDDKTFTNKSWSDATGIKLKFINEYEKNWLKIFDWKLYDDKFISYNDYVNAFEYFCKKYQPQNTNSLLNTPLHSSSIPISIPLPNSTSPTSLSSSTSSFYNNSFDQSVYSITPSTSYNNMMMNNSNNSSNTKNYNNYSKYLPSKGFETPSNINSNIYPSPSYANNFYYNPNNNTTTTISSNTNNISKPNALNIASICTPISQFSPSDVSFNSFLPQTSQIVQQSNTCSIPQLMQPPQIIHQPHQMNLNSLPYWNLDQQPHQNYNTTASTTNNNNIRIEKLRYPPFENYSTVY